MRTACTSCRWNRMSFAAPQRAAYVFTVHETVLRDAMSSDSLDPAGIYFGTRSGKVYGSRDEGKSWKKLVDGLPQILCLKAAVVQMDGAPPPKPNLKPETSKRRKTSGTKRVKRTKSN